MNIADLMMPIADAELRDPELERLERRARSEAKRRAKDAWHCQWLKCEAAMAAYKALDYQRLVQTFYGEAEKPCSKEMRRLFTAWQREALRLMHVPAPTKANLNEKKRLVKPLVNEFKFWGDLRADEEKLNALVAADEERLARR